MPCLEYGIDSIKKGEETQESTVSGTVELTKRFHE